MPYKGGRRDPAKLKFDKEYYTPEGAKSLSDRQLRKEYSRLRSIARKRLERFEGTEWTDSEVYKKNAGKYKALKDIESNRELRHLFSDLSHYITAETSTVSGLEQQRKTAVATLTERGFDFVTKENFRQFADFMEYSRTTKIAKMLDSKRVAEYYAAEERKQKSKKQLQKEFRKWAKEQIKLKKMQNKDPRNSDMYRSQIEDMPKNYTNDGKMLAKSIGSIASIPMPQNKKVKSNKKRRKK